jgi:RNA polymerase sigma-70 factor, ECF subfamily
MTGIDAGSALQREPAAGSAVTSGVSGRPVRPIPTEIGRDIVSVIPALRRYARRLAKNPITADDLLQDTLTRAIERLERWQPGTNLRAWLFTIMHNLYVSDLRRAARESRVFTRPSIEPTAVSPADQGDGLRIRDLRRALAALPQEQRSVVLLIGIDGVPYDGVAKRLDIPIGTVRSRASRGRRMLRQLTEGIRIEAA